MKEEGRLNFGNQDVKLELNSENITKTFWELVSVITYVTVIDDPVEIVAMFNSFFAKEPKNLISHISNKD